VTTDYLLLIVNFFFIKNCVIDLLFSVLVSNALSILVDTRVGITEATKGNMVFRE